MISVAVPLVAFCLFRSSLEMTSTALAVLVGLVCLLPATSASPSVLETSVYGAWLRFALALVSQSMLLCLQMTMDDARIGYTVTVWLLSF